MDVNIDIERTIRRRHSVDGDFNVPTKRIRTEYSRNSQTLGKIGRDSERISPNFPKNLTISRIVSKFCKMIKILIESPQFSQEFDYLPADPREKIGG